MQRYLLSLRGLCVSFTTALPNGLAVCRRSGHPPGTGVVKVVFKLLRLSSFTTPFGLSLSKPGTKVRTLQQAQGERGKNCHEFGKDQ